VVESLLAIIRMQQDRIQQLEETVQQLRDEIAILKGQKPRPQIAPSRLEARSEQARPPGGKRPGSDDTGARHGGQNGFCTFIGNDLFSYFESTDSKSRLHFLQVLQGSQCRYVINDTSIAYWRREGLSVAWRKETS